MPRERLAIFAGVHGDDHVAVAWGEGREPLAGMKQEDVVRGRNGQLWPGFVSRHLGSVQATPAQRSAQDRRGEELPWPPLVGTEESAYATVTEQPVTDEVVDARFVELPLANEPREETLRIGFGQRMETSKRGRLEGDLRSAKLVHDRAPLVVPVHEARLRAPSPGGRVENAGTHARGSLRCPSR